MSKDNPFEKEVSYNYPVESQKTKPLPTEKKQEKDVEKWGDDSNAYLKHNNIPKRVINVDKGQEVYSSTWHTFLTVFFLLVIIGGIVFGCWGIYNDKFKTVFYDNSSVVCEATTIPECPTAPACPICPSLTCGNVTVQMPSTLNINYTGGNQSG